MENLLASLSPLLTKESMREFVRSEIHDDPASPAELVIASARGGPRTIEWLFGNLQDTAVPIVTERAIPFLSMEIKNRNILLFDDSIIFGSTLADLKKKLDDLGARTRISSLVLDEFWLLGEGISPWSGETPKPSKFLPILRPFHALCTLPTRLLPPYHRLILRSFRSIGKPYTIDFPIFTGTVPKEYSSWDEVSWETYLLRATNGSPFCLTPKEGTDRPIQAFSLCMDMNKLIDCLFLETSGLQFDKQTKLRLHISRETNEMRLTPMLVARIENWRDISIVFHEPVLNECWQYLADIVKSIPNTEISEEERGISFYRSLVFIASMGAGILAWPVLLSNLGLPVTPSPRLSEDDAALVFGQRVGHRIVEFCGSVCESLKERNSEKESTEAFSFCFQSTEPDIRVTQSHLDEFVCDSPQLVNRYRNWINEREIRDIWKLESELTMIENLQRIFLALRDIADEGRRPDAEDSARLRVGFTFRDLQYLLLSGGVRFDTKELCYCVDLLVDTGIIVPMVGYRENSTELVKMYRSGERVHAELFAATLHECMTEWQTDTGARGLSDLAFAKVCVVLARLFPSAVPFSPGQHSHGAALFVDGETDIVRWALRHRIVRRQTDEQQ